MFIVSAGYVGLQVTKRPYFMKFKFSPGQFNMIILPTFPAWASSYIVVSLKIFLHTM